MFEILNNDNIMLYCAKHYENPHCTGIDDFNDDLNHVKYLKRLFNRYQKGDELKINLIFNHLILLYNVFDSQAITRVLFHRINEEHWTILKPCLIALSQLPETILGVSEKHKIINTVDIPLDQSVVKEVRIVLE